MRRIRSAAFAALLVLAPGLALAAGAPEAEDFTPLLSHRLLLQLAEECLRAHPGMRDQIEHIGEAWLAKNAVALAEYNARYAALPKERQAEVENRFQQISAAWRTRLEHEEAAGNGELACTNQLVRLDSEPPMTTPAAVSASEPAPAPASVPAAEPAPEPASEPSPAQG
jgi:hypothetical protein